MSVVSSMIEEEHPLLCVGGTFVVQIHLLRTNIQSGKICAICVRYNVKSVQNMHILARPIFSGRYDMGVRLI